MRIKNIFFALILLTTIACNKTETTVEGNQTVAGTDNLTAEALYPHTEEMLKNHGSLYLNSNKSCMTCHGENLLGGTSKVSCQKCHVDYPHNALFAMGKAHGERFGAIIAQMRANGDRVKDFEYLRVNSCTQCHNAKKDPTKKLHPYSAKNISCNSCHLPFPHGKHDDAGNGKALQASCHNCHRPTADETKLTYMPTKKSCAQCHDDNEIGTKAVTKFMTEEEAEQISSCLDEIRDGNECALKPAAKE